MAIEQLQSGHVSINGRVIETPQQYPDEHTERLRSQAPLFDAVYDLKAGHLPLIEIDRTFEAYQHIPRFIERAKRAAHEHGVSYRDFKVGASAYAVDTDGARVGYFFGANYTPFKGAPKRCAEMEVLDKAREHGFDKIIAIATFGPSEHSDVNHVSSPTLHPCAQCRDLFSNDPLVHDDTLFVTSNGEGDIEMMLTPDLMQLHETAQQSTDSLLPLQ